MSDFNLSDIDLTDASVWERGAPHEWLDRLRVREPRALARGVGRSGLLGADPPRGRPTGFDVPGRVLELRRRAVAPRHGRRLPGPAADGDHRHGPARPPRLPHHRVQGVHAEDDRPARGVAPGRDRPGGRRAARWHELRVRRRCRRTDPDVVDQRADGRPARGPAPALRAEPRPDRRPGSRDRTDAGDRDGVVGRDLRLRPRDGDARAGSTHREPHQRAPRGGGRRSPARRHGVHALLPVPHRRRQRDHPHGDVARAARPCSTTRSRSTDWCRTRA